MLRINYSGNFMANPMRAAGKRSGVIHALSSRQGFTFVEMMLASILVAVIAVAIYGMLSNGIKVWERVSGESPAIDVNLFVDRIGVDLKNCLNFNNVEFTGTSTSVEFPAMVAPPIPENQNPSAIGSISYRYDADSQTVQRNCVNYNNFLSAEQPEPRVLVEGVQSLNFEYYFFDKEKDTFFWAPQWPPEGGVQAGKYPLAVRVSLVIPAGDTIEQRSKTISLPIGGFVE